jgi:hypothetical protein
MQDNGGPAVLAEGLVKHFTGREGDVEAVRGVDLLGRADLLPAAVPDPEPGPARSFDGPDGGGRDRQPRHLPDGGAPVPDPRRSHWGKILPGFGVVLALGVVMLFLNVRTIQRYD